MPSGAGDIPVGVESLSRDKLSQRCHLEYEYSFRKLIPIDSPPWCAFNVHIGVISLQITHT